MLSPAQVQSFLAHWLGPDWSLGELKAQVATRCQGVPLYLEEVLRTLETSNAIEGTPGSYRLIDPLVVDKLPRTLHALLAERMDRWYRQAEEKGLQEGLQKGEARMLLRQLHLKFSPLAPEVEKRVLSADKERLEEWSERVLTAERLQDVFGD